MGKVVYLMNVSLDGFVETPDHSIDWRGSNPSSPASSPRAVLGVKHEPAQLAA
jgi:hypothetical protein